MSELLKAMDNAKGDYCAMFSEPDNAFWTVEPDGNMYCRYGYFRANDMINVIDDKDSGYTIFQSLFNKKYVEARAENGYRLSAAQNRIVSGTYFNIDGRGRVKSDMSKLYVSADRSNRILSAKDNTGTDYTKFKVRPVSVSNLDSTLYLSPGARNNKHALTMNSTTPVKFYLLVDPDGAAYLETASYEFLFAENSVDPVTYGLTDMKLLNFRLDTVKPEKETDPNVFGLRSQFIGNKFFVMKDDGTNKYIYCDADDCSANFAKFRFHDII